MNQKILDEIVNMDYARLQSNIQKSLSSYLKEHSLNGFILGLSGGVDSAVAAYLCANVSKEKTIALIMPDTKISPQSETSDALKIVEELGIEYKLLDISMIINSYSKFLEPDEKAIGNLRARVRTNILYYYANIKNYLVVGSSDKSEHLVGYFTKFGDGGADFLPIVSLYKSQVRELGKHLGISNSIAEKKSSPHLWKNHLAEDELGASYEQIDSVLYCIFDKKYSLEDTTKKTQIEKSLVEKIYQLYQKSQHKRSSAATPFDEQA